MMMDELIMQFQSHKLQAFLSSYTQSRLFSWLNDFLMIFISQSAPLVADYKHSFKPHNKYSNKRHDNVPIENK